MSDPAAPQRPTAAGMYDYYLGGTAHTPTDSAAGRQILDILPEVADVAWANRGFLQRAVRWLTAEQGIRQFLDIGSGLPTERNTHDVVSGVTPDGRVVYVDIDPVVVSRSQQMLFDTPRAAMIEGDIRNPDAILDHPQTQRLIDLTQPVGLLMVAVLHFVPDEDDPWGLVEHYLAALPAGSYLALSHASADNIPPRVRDAGLKIYANSANPATERARTEVERFFTGLQIVPPYVDADPVVSHVGLWGAEDPTEADSDGSPLFYAAVARKQ